MIYGCCEGFGYGDSHLLPRSLIAAPPGPATRRLVSAGWLGVTLSAVFTFPDQSTDMGDYIYRARMIVHFPPGGYHAATAAAILLVPQILAVYFVVKGKLPGTAVTL